MGSQTQLFSTTIARIFDARQKPLLHKAVDHLAGSRAGNPQVFPNVGNTAGMAMVKLHQCRDLRKGEPRIIHEALKVMERAAREDFSPIA
jgi:hypothetical protein